MTAPEGLALVLAAVLLIVWLVRHRQYAAVSVLGLVKVEMADKPPAKPKPAGRRSRRSPPPTD